MQQNLLPYVEKLKSELSCCVQSTNNTYTAGAHIYSSEEQKSSQLAIILSGQAMIYTIDLNGNRNIVEILNENDFFGESFLATSSPILYYVEAKTACEIMFISSANLIHPCDHSCIHHEEILRSLLEITSIKSQSTMMHLDIISQRSIRGKLLSLFSYLGLNKSHPEITLPFSWTEAADYISTERSAMMRELGKMKQEGIITYSNRAIAMKE